MSCHVWTPVDLSVVAPHALGSAPAPMFSSRVHSTNARTVESLVCVCLHLWEATTERLPCTQPACWASGCIHLHCVPSIWGFLFPCTHAPLQIFYFQLLIDKICIVISHFVGVFLASFDFRILFYLFELCVWSLVEIIHLQTTPYVPSAGSVLWFLIF